MLSLNISSIKIISEDDRVTLLEQLVDDFERDVEDVVNSGGG
jgi:hypothetical protein